MFIDIYIWGAQLQLNWVILWVICKALLVLHFPTFLIIKSKLTNVRKQGISISQGFMIVCVKHHIHLTHMLTHMVLRRFCYPHFTEEESQFSIDTCDYKVNIWQSQIQIQV